MIGLKHIFVIAHTYIDHFKTEVHVFYTCFITNLLIHQHDPKNNIKSRKGTKIILGSARDHQEEYMVRLWHTQQYTLLRYWNNRARKNVKTVWFKRKNHLTPSLVLFWTIDQTIHYNICCIYSNGTIINLKEWWLMSKTLEFCNFTKLETQNYFVEHIK